jgi:hypothetical protein
MIDGIKILFNKENKNHYFAVAVAAAMAATYYALSSSTNCDKLNLEIS